MNELKPINNRPAPQKGKTPSGNESAGLLDLAKAILDAKKEYALVKEQEETKRHAISADLHKFQVAIDAKKELLEAHLAREFGLRKETIEEVLLRLDKAMENNQDSVAAEALSRIQGIVATNPLNGVAEIGRLFESGSGVLEI